MATKKNKKKLNEKLRQIYKELKIDEQDKKNRSISSAAENRSEIAAAGSLTIIQLKDPPEKDEGKQPQEKDKRFDKLAGAIESLIKRLTGNAGPKGDPGKNGTNGAAGDFVEPTKSGNFITRGLKSYVSGRVDQFKQATSAEGILGLAGVTPGEGLLGSLLGAHMANRDAKKQEKEDEETYIKTFSESTEVGRSLSKEEQVKVGKELYQKEKKSKAELERLEEKGKVARAFGGSLSKEDELLMEKQRAALEEVAAVKRGNSPLVNDEERGPATNKQNKKRRASEESDAEKSSNPTIEKESSESEEFIKERNDLIREVLAGVDEAVKNATPEQKADLFAKGGKEYILGVKEGIMEELLKINQEQLEQLKKFGEVDPKDVENNEEKTIEKNEEKQTKLLEEVSKKLTVTEEDVLEKGKKSGGSSILDVGKKALDKNKEKGGLLDSLKGMFDAVKGFKDIGGVLKDLGSLGRMLGPAALLLGKALLVLGTFVAAFKLGSWLNDKLLTNEDGSNKIVNGLDNLGVGPTTDKKDSIGLSAKNPAGDTDIIEKSILEKHIKEGWVTPTDVKNAKKYGINVDGLPVSTTGKPVADKPTMMEKALDPKSPAVVEEKVKDLPTPQDPQKIESGTEKDDWMFGDKLADNVQYSSEVLGIDEQEVPPGASLPPNPISLTLPGSKPKFKYEGSLLRATPSSLSVTPESPQTPSRVALLGEMKNQEAEQERRKEEREAKASTIISNSNNQSTVVNNNGGDSSGKAGRSTSRPIDGVNEDRYQFLQRRLVF